MRGERTAALRVTWLATALALVLAIATPAVARVAGERAASPVLRSSAVEPIDASRAARAGLRADGPPVAAPARAASDAEQAHDRRQEQPSLLVDARPGMVAHRNPWASSPTVGTVATVSRYYRVPIVLWIEEVSRNGAWGRVELPYSWPRREGWIELKGMRTRSTHVRVEVDLSEHRVRVFKHGSLVANVSGATGAPISPTPPGDYVVTDRVPFSAGSYLGSFAFGISGIQPKLPPGWSGGDQLAIHGTNSPGSIGRSVSAGCVRVSEWALARLKPFLQLGTPVVIRP